MRSGMAMKFLYRTLTAILLCAPAIASAQIGSVFDVVWPTGTTAAPTFSLSSATALPMYSSVTIASATNGSSVCYTIDGSAPTLNSAGACTNGLTTATYVMTPSASTITFNAIAAAPSMLTSATSAITYTIDHSIPVFLNSTEAPATKSAVASVTVPYFSYSPAVSVTAGQFVYVWCKSNKANGATAIGISDNLGSTYNMLPGYLGFDDTADPVPIYQSGWTFAASSSAKATFTCTSNATAAGMAAIALVYYPGSLSTLDSQVNSYTTSNSASWTSPVFSTTGKGLIIACGDLYNYGTFSPGIIGAQTANMRAVSGYTPAGNSMCEDVVTNPLYPVQTDITAAMNNSISAVWVGGVGAFK